MSGVEEEIAHLRRMPKDYGMTVEAILSLECSFSEAVSKLIICEYQLRMIKEPSLLVPILGAELQLKVWECYFCGKTRLFARDC